jgi:branched-chain amino acid aminotransferase
MFYLKGNYLAEKDAHISVLDLGLLRGFGVFDYLRTYRGRPFHLQDHLLRLQYSAEQLGLTLPHSLEEITQIIARLLSLSKLPEASIKILLTGGVSPDQFTPPSASELIAFVYPLSPIPPSAYTLGIPVVTTRLGRSLPTSKTTQYAPAIVALQSGKLHKAKEALYLNAQEEILEATTSNFFAIKNGTLYTCASNEVLFGITREILLTLAKDHYPIALASIRYNELSSIDEAFITSSNREVMPVVAIDGQPIGAGTVGPKTRHLMQRFQAYTEQDHWPLLNITRYQSSLATQ